jgi:DNA-binding PadR family transcriptional regulator
MNQDIEGFAGSRLGPGTLYGALTRLEDRGLIEPVASTVGEDRLKAL